MVKLKDICYKITDGSHNPPQGITKSNYLMLSSKNVYDDLITFDEPRYLTEKDFLIENRRTNVSSNDILLTIVGTIGRVAVVPETAPKLCLQRSVAVLKPDLSIVIPRFLMYQLQNLRPKIEAEAKGVAQKGIYLKQVESLEISSFSLDRQKKIVYVLDEISKLISLRKKQLQKLDDLIKSRFAEMFGDVIDEDTLLNLCNIIDYRGKTPDKANAGLPFITAKNVKKHHLSLEPREYITKETYDKVMTRGFPREGDVIFTTEAPLGNMCRLPRFETEFYVGQRIVTLQTKKLNPAYLEYALDTTDFQTKLFEKSSGSTVTGIRVRLLEQLTIPVPSREGQDRFAAFVDAIEKNKRDVQQALDKLEQMKQALMQKYFG